MTEWISITEPPKSGTLCLTWHKGFSADFFLATYSCSHGKFRLYNPHYRDNPLIDCTHYFVIPDIPYD